MVELILVTLLIFITFLSYFKSDLYKNYYFIFNLWWSIWLIMALINPYNFYKVNIFTFLIIVLGIFSFNGTLILPKIKIKQLKIGIVNINKVRISKKIMIIFLLYNLYLGLEVCKLLNFSFVEYWRVRQYFFGIEGQVYLFGRNIFHILYNFLFSLNKAIFLYGLILSLYKNKNSKMIIFLSTLNLMLYSFISGGRKELFSLVVLIVFVIIFSKKIKIFLKPLMFLLMIIILISYYRGFLKVTESIVLYFSGSIFYFSRLQELDIENKVYPFYLLTNYLLTPIYAIYSKMSNTIIQTSYDIIATDLKQYIVISHDGKTYNALSTIFYYFYKDFGVVSVIIYSFLLSFFYKIIVDSNNKKNESIVLNSYLISLLLLCIFNNPYEDTKSLFPILILYLFFTNKYKYTNI